MNTTSRRELILSMAVAGAALDLSRSPVIAAPTRVPRTPVALEQVRHSLAREQHSVQFRHVQKWMKNEKPAPPKTIDMMRRSDSSLRVAINAVGL
jgi:hypothetical protein